VEVEIGVRIEVDVQNTFSYAGK